MTPQRCAEIYALAFADKRPWTTDEFADLIGSAHGIMTSISDACFALGRVVAGQAELITIATEPAKQRQGHAKTCLSDFVQQCCARQAEAIFLEVDEQNTGAMALYSAFGFAETRRREGYYVHKDGSQTAAILMTLKT